MATARQAQARLWEQPGDIYYVGSNAPSMMPVPTKQPEAQMALESLAKTVEMLHHTVNELQARLADVLTPDEPRNKERVATPRSTVPLVQRIVQCDEQAANAVECLQAVIRRIEV